MWSDSPDAGKHFQHEWATPNHALELAGIYQLPIEAQGFLTFLGLCNETTDSGAKLFDIEGLRPIVARSFLNRLHSRFRRIVARDQNDVRCWVNRDNALQQLNTVHLWHDQIKQNDPRPSFQKYLEAHLRVIRGQYLHYLFLESGAD